MMFHLKSVGEQLYKSYSNSSLLRCGHIYRCSTKFRKQIPVIQIGMTFDFTQISLALTNRKLLDKWLLCEPDL